MSERKKCAACQALVAAESVFCGYCGFRLSAISEAAHQALADHIRASAATMESPAHFEPLPALCGDGEPELPELDASAVAYADTLAARQRAALEQASTEVGPRDLAARWVGPGRTSAADGALDKTRSRSEAAQALLEPTHAAPGLEPAAALPGAEPGTDAADENRGGTLSYAAGQGAAGQGAAGQGAAGQGAANPSGRRMHRFPIKVEVSYSSAHNFYTGVIENVSSGGIFVATDTPGAIGDEYEVSFTVPGLDKPCTAVCQVRWIREVGGTSAPAGMGLRFVRLHATTRAAIELFLRHREPILFEG
jgi:uncharacterized protein (TIGR02266 family)